MLQTLTIRNYAIIDHLDLEFGPGLNVLTGETGAGKSIILNALNAILGGRIESAMVRGDAPRAMIDAVFEVGGSSDLAAFLGEMGFALEDDLMLLSREITASGKSSARIGGRPATIAQLKAVGEWLVDLHGQHEHQSLLSVPRHLDILDEWGGKEVIALRSQVAEAYHHRVRLERERAELETSARERAHLIDLYQFQIHEIAEAGLRPGEEEEIVGEARRLANAQRLAEIAATAASALSGEERAGALEALGAAARCLEEGAVLDDRLTSLAETLNAARYELEEAARDLARYQDEIEYNPERLHNLEERLELIRNLKRKYGDTIEEILEYHRQTADRLNALMNCEVRGQELDAAIVTAVERLHALCEQLSDRRRLLASDFAATVLSELGDLAMEKTRFEVQIEIGEPTAKGRDRVEFVIAANPGEPLRPLARIASGGEISRVMLAIKSAMARQDPLPTMVFDEIDVGVGGRTATVIGQKLSALARAAQVICITHLPQIASRGDTHLYIEKQVTGDRTTVALLPLSAQERVQEIARMLGGDQNNETVIKLAEEMLQTR